MNRLYPLVLEHRLPIPILYGISASIMVGCAVLQMALQMQTGVPGYFLLLPGVFLSGLIFDRGCGIFAAVIAVGVGACISYAGGFGLDFLATNSLFAITAAGTATVAEFQRAELRRVMLADKTKTVLLQEMAHRTKNKPRDPQRHDPAGGKTRRAGGRGRAGGDRAPAAGYGGGLRPSLA